MFVICHAYVHIPSGRPCGVYTLFRLICLARYVLTSLSIGFRGTKFDIYRELVQNKVDNRKPQAGGHVTGLCRRSISGRKAGPFVKFTHRRSFASSGRAFFIFSRAVFRPAPQLLDRFEESNESRESQI